MDTQLSAHAAALALARASSEKAIVANAAEAEMTVATLQSECRELAGMSELTGRKLGEMAAAEQYHEHHKARSSGELEVLKSRLEVETLQRGDLHMEVTKLRAQVVGHEAGSTESRKQHMQASTAASEARRELADARRQQFSREALLIKEREAVAKQLQMSGKEVEALEERLIESIGERDQAVQELRSDRNTSLDMRGKTREELHVARSEGLRALAWNRALTDETTYLRSRCGALEAALEVHVGAAVASAIVNASNTAAAQAALAAASKINANSLLLPGIHGSSVTATAASSHMSAISASPRVVTTPQLSGRAISTGGGQFATVLSGVPQVYAARAATTISRQSSASATRRTSASPSHASNSGYVATPRRELTPRRGMTPAHVIQPPGSSVRSASYGASASVPASPARSASLGFSASAPLTASAAGSVSSSPCVGTGAFAVWPVRPQADGTLARSLPQCGVPQTSLSNESLGGSYGSIGLVAPPCTPAPGALVSGGSMPTPGSAGAGVGPSLREVYGPPRHARTIARMVSAPSVSPAVSPDSTGLS